MAANNAQNVSTTKGIAGGYLFSAPRTAATLALVLTLGDFTVQLTDAFVNLGHVAADGIVEGESADTNTDTDMNGDAVNTSRSNRVETEKFTLLENKKDSLAEQYGHSNVTDVSGLLTVHHNNDEREHRVYVAELVLKDGRRWRKVVPDGQVTEVADLTINSTTLTGREVTVTCNAYTWTEGSGSSAKTHVDTVIDFMQSSETKAS